MLHEASSKISRPQGPYLEPVLSTPPILMDFYSSNYLNFGITAIFTLFTRCGIQNIHIFSHRIGFWILHNPQNKASISSQRLFKIFSLYRRRSILLWDVNITVFSGTNYGALGRLSL